MKGYYKDMPQDFRNAVETIKLYCQNENCDLGDCEECPYPLSVIRCGDERESEEV